MPSFEQIGLREELLRTLEEEGITNPTAVQAALVPGLRRGVNAAARASSGSGKTLAYTLGILDRLGSPPTATTDGDEQVTTEGGDEPGEGRASSGPRMLVVAPSRETAESIALEIVPYAHSTGHQVTVPAAGWSASTDGASILVAPPEELALSVRGSALKLHDVEAVVIDGAEIMVQLGTWEHVDSLLDLVPRDAQRVLFAATLSEAVEDLISRRIKRALRYPSEPAVQTDRPTAPASSVGYILAGEREKLRLLTGQLAGREPDGTPPIIFCRTDERAADLAESLTIRGFLVGPPGDSDADVAIAAADVARDELLADGTGDPPPGIPQTISFDVPADAATLRDRHSGDADAVVLLEPHELAHLREIATQAGFAITATPIAPPRTRTAAELEAYRAELRSAIEGEDLSAQMLVLAPLFEEFTPAEVAAAASALLRSRRPQTPAPLAAQAPSPAAAAEAATIAPQAGRKREQAPAGPAPVTWARLYVSIGSRDEIRPADIVGTLAGEANIPGSRIGKIEIRDSFSIVEVQADVADQVIRAVNGTTMKGRSIRVDYDRGGPARRPPPRTGPPRRTTRRPPG